MPSTAGEIFVTAFYFKLSVFLLFGLWIILMFMRDSTLSEAGAGEEERKDAHVSLARCREELSVAGRRKGNAQQRWKWEPRIRKQRC